MKRKLKSVALILLAASLMVIPVSAEPGTSNLENQKDKIEKEIAVLEDKLEEVWTNMYETEAKLAEKGEEILLVTEELAQAEREESWRQMARQMAHEIKNPLTPMKLLSQRLLLLEPNNIEEYHETVKSSAEILLHGIESITSTTNALSDFARTPVAQASVINIVDYVQYVVELFRNSNENINITFNSTSDSVLVMADRDLVISMFSNLINKFINIIV